MNPHAQTFMVSQKPGQPPGMAGRCRAAHHPRIDSCTPSPFGHLAFAAGFAPSFRWLALLCFCFAQSAKCFGQVCLDPEITVSPQGQTKCVGKSVTFTAQIKANTCQVTWKWYGPSGTPKQTRTTSGVVSDSYTIPSVQASDAGSYYVTVATTGSPVPSTKALLTVNVAPSISVSGQPKSVTANVGADVTFSVSASGTPTLGYQWRRNGTSLSAATGSSYRIANVQTTSAGSYSVVVNNPCDFVISADATLTVNVPVTPPTITTPPLSQTVARGSNVSFSVAATGTVPLSYQWRLNNGNISGATASSFTTNNVQVTSQGTYRVIVANTAGSVTSDGASLKVIVPPALTSPGRGAGGPFQFVFTNAPGAAFRVLATTNPALALSRWTNLGLATETPAGSGSYQFTDVSATNFSRRYFRAMWP
jgi:hypothetical protein